MEPLIQGRSTRKVATRTLSFKIRPEADHWLDKAACEVNLVWNYCNELSYRAIRNYSGKSKWLSKSELCSHTAGSSKEFEHIGSDTVQRVCFEYVQKRVEARKVKLRWRKSRGVRRSLGWIPFKASNIQRHGKYLRFCGKAFRIFESERFRQIEEWRQGSFVQDSVGDWYLKVPVTSEDDSPWPTDLSVGIDLGLTQTAVTSDDDRLSASRYYRRLEPKIAQAQRRGHKRQAKRLHRQAKRQRQAAQHEFTRKIVNRYQFIFIGDVSSQAMIKGRFSKAAFDCSWASLKRQLQYKGTAAGRVVEIVDERNTSRTCSSCRVLTGPTGVNGLRVRVWTCESCGAVHDRDLNAAKNIRLAGRLPPSVYGNEMHCGQPPPSRVECPREEWIVAAESVS